MSLFIAWLMALCLFAVSITHFLWAMGCMWPIRDESLLAKSVAGFDGIEKMPPRSASFAVAVATLAAGVAALLLGGDGGGLWLKRFCIACGAVFLLRGAIAYTRWWARITPEPRFRINDRRYYAPLCLFLGMGFVALICLGSV